MREEKQMLEVGIKGLEQQAVSAENTALALGSGTLEAVSYTHLTLPTIA